MVVQDETAYVFYFTHPGRADGAAEDEDTYATRRPLSRLPPQGSSTAGCTATVTSLYDSI